MARFESFTTPRIPRRAVPETAPLSFAQQRLWFLDQFEPNSPLYEVHSALRLRGRLETGALQQALQALVKRHETLRTRFVAVDGVPVQMIAESQPMELVNVNLTERPVGEREKELPRLLQEETRRPFELSCDAMLRAKLFWLDSQDHVLLLTMHHIVSDGWSMGILFRELSALYQAFTHGEPSPLPDLPIQYGDYSVWQRERLQGEVLATQLYYWKRTLDAVPTLQLSADHKRPAVQTFRGARQQFMFSRPLYTGLKTLSRKHRLTLFITLLAAFQTLLRRYTGQDDIVVGSPIAGRTRQDLEGLIGLFVNTLVLRTDLSGNPSFVELLRRVRQVALGAYVHQELPFEKLVEELQPQRSLSHSALFQVMFVLDNTPNAALNFEGLTVTPLEVETGLAKFDLTLTVRECADGLRGSLRYNTDLFDAATVSSMVGHLRTLLEGIVANPEQRLSEFPILTEIERRQLLFEWNDTRVPYPKDMFIHELFEAVAQRTPDAVALVFDDQQLSYRELNRRANQLSHYLRELGVGPEVLVGICMKRSVEMVVAVLGILKAGGAYVPLDPEYPFERIGFMIEDSRVSVLLSEQRLCELVSGHGARVVYVDAEWDEIARQNDQNYTGGLATANLAYLLYTSGSTGTPKGVAIEHHGPQAFLSWAQSVFNRAQISGVLASTSLSFDLSVFELFVPLISGGTIILAENALALPDLPAASKVTLINTVPSAIVELVRLNGIPSSVDTINLCGEPLKTSLVRELYEQTSVKCVYDLYGPSEDTTYSTFALRTSSGPQTIGRPIANTQCYILDGSLQPLPIGVAGELHLAGQGMARGYYNRPELTAEKFVPNPFSAEPGARLYKTGDLARYLPDGNIEFLGRIDHQVKIRGFRVELGEIESLLAQHPSIAEAVVVIREDRPTEKLLVAYIVAKQQLALAAPELPSFLKQKLPDYMVPNTFVFLRSLPLTPNGKVDRSALPGLDERTPEREENLVASRSLTEEKVTGIWEDVLCRKGIGMHDNFFALGGHSLLATQVISRLRNVFHLDLPLRALFEKPTVAELAATIVEVKTQSQNPDRQEMSQTPAESESLLEEKDSATVTQKTQQTGNDETKI